MNSITNIKNDTTFFTLNGGDTIGALVMMLGDTACHEYFFCAKMGEKIPMGCILKKAQFKENTNV